MHFLHAVPTFVKYATVLCFVYSNQTKLQHRKFCQAALEFRSRFHHKAAAIGIKIK